MPKVGQRSALRSRLLRVFAGFDACDLPESAPAIGSQTFMRLPCRLTGLGGVEVMAAAVGVEGREQAVRCDHLLEPHKARSRALLLDQDGREHRARGVV